MDNQGHYSDYAEPITLMKELTLRGGTFKISFRKKNGKPRVIHRAQIRKQPRTKDDNLSAYKIQLIDKDREELRSAYIPLILAVNDKPIIL